MLVLYFYQFSGLTVPQSQMVLKIRLFSVFHMLIRWLVNWSHAVARVPLCTATQLNVSVCHQYLNDIFLSTWHKSCLSSALSVNGATWTAFHLSWGDVRGHTTHHGAELPGGQASGEMWSQQPSGGHDTFKCPKCCQILFSTCSTPRCEYVGEWRCRPSNFMYLRGQHAGAHCASFLSFNFWIVNACANTGVLSHPMNVCKYAGVTIAASGEKAQRLFWNHILKQMSACEDL